MTEITPSVWDLRWHALDQHLGMLKDDATSEDIAISRRDVLVPLIDALRAFGDSHFHYFNQFFQNSALSKSDNFPPGFVIRQVIARIAEDAQVIQSCLEQRLPGRGDGYAQEVLLKADNLAWAALRFAIARGLLPEETTAITYFQKAASIRVIPYASVALIGIPITCLDNPIDYLAIPHEVGHYVYWNSGIFLKDRPVSIQAKLTEAMKRQPYWIQRWKQEIFADTYGALVAQAAIACSFQDLEYESSKVDLMLDDKKHPAPIIRPEIYNEAISRHNSDLASALSDRWSNLIQNRHSILRLDSQNKWAYLKVHDDADSTDILLPKEIRDNYVGLLDEIDRVLPLRPPNGQEPNFPGRGETNLEKVYPSFSDGIETFINQIPTGSIDAKISTQTWEDWVTQFNLKAGQVPVSQWMNVFLAGGWTTEGPQGRDLID